jgi:predicted Zn-dependent protease
MRTAYSLIFILIFAACSSQPLDQDGGNLTRSEVELLSRRLSEAIEQEFPLVSHKMVNRYVTTLGQSIIARNPDMPPLPYEFKVIRSNEMLLFSLPGGTIYVTLGALRAANIEGEFAAALAHELAHQQLNHQLIQWRRKVNANRGQRYLLDFSGAWKDNFLGPSGALMLEKGMEQEADELAPVILYRAKFDPRVYTAYLQLLRRLEQKSPGDVATLLSLHPSFQERIAWTTAALLKLPPVKDANVSSESFEQVKDLLRETAKKSEKNEKSKGKKP